jgi:hypothetical protein
MSVILKHNFNSLSPEEQQQYQVMAESLLAKDRSDSLSAATLTKLWRDKGLVEQGASKDNNPAERFLKKCEKLDLVKIERQNGGGRKGNVVTLKYYAYTGTPLQGTVPWQHPLYIKRNADSDCERWLNDGIMPQKTRIFLKIKSPRYTGKTSLLIRLKQFLKDTKIAVAFVDLESCKFTDQLFTDRISEKTKSDNLTEFLRVFQAVVVEEFRPYIRAGLQSVSGFSTNISPGVALTNDLECKVFNLIEKPKVLFIDGIDRILGSSIQDSFFRILRTWSEEKMKKIENQSFPNWPNIVMAFSTESYFDRESPLQNIGTDIKLNPFTEDHILGLAQLYGLEWNNDSIVENANTLKKLLGGNPYLINMALTEMSRENIDVKTLHKKAFSPDSFFLKHLRKIGEMINQKEDLKSTLCHWLSDHSFYLDEKSKLQLAKLGVIEFDSQNKPKISCQLYEEYFQQFCSISH